MDNDVYGHVNNVVYYSWFDTAVNAHLIEQGALDIHAGDTIGLVIETQCNYFAPLAFPQTVEAGIRVARIGSSSVRYEVGLFASGEALSAAAGHFVHVYVDRATRRPVPAPEWIDQPGDSTASRFFRTTCRVSPGSPMKWKMRVASSMPK